MPSEIGDNPTAAAALAFPIAASMGGSADDAPSLPCPRCESTNTKFCYYNNYNLSQPRHFCKSCRRYWTQGGSLRNVPVGGGTRKSSSAASSSKRQRASSASAAAVTTTTTTNNNNYSNINMDSSASTNTTTSSSSNSTTSMSSLAHEQQHDHYSDPPLHLGFDPVFRSVAEAGKCDELSNLKENRQPVVSENGIGSGSFISLLNNQGGGLVGSLTGYGSGHGYGFCDMDLGLAGNAAAARGMWPYYSASSSTTTTDYLGGGDGVGCGGNVMGAWAQVGEMEKGNGSGGGSYVDPEGFSWPTFVIPTTAKGLMK
ncbi:unnamed protein product [Linum tenue]|uniref:Dof zinc finger protein n=1 Tax=Linum tenue TaxID=586396 RepID=A0AAV0P426_9ROSI|nr:unnamed protein product [Linum tenue]CAI0465397.1 unnamed protein product [Linum tenue]